MAEAAALERPPPNLAPFCQPGLKEVCGYVQEFRAANTHIISDISAQLNGLDMQFRLLAPSAERLDCLDARMGTLERVLDSLLHQLRLTSASYSRSSVGKNVCGLKSGGGGQAPDRKNRQGRTSAVEVQSVRDELEQVKMERQRLRDQLVANAKVKETMERRLDSECAQLRQELDNLLQEKEQWADTARAMEESCKQLLDEKLKLAEDQMELQEKMEEERSEWSSLRQSLEADKQALLIKIKSINMNNDEVIQAKPQKPKKPTVVPKRENSQKSLQKDQQHVETEKPRLDRAKQESPAEDLTMKQSDDLKYPGPTPKMIERAGTDAGGTYGAVQLMSPRGEYRWTVGEYRTVMQWQRALKRPQDGVICGSNFLLPASLGGWEIVLQLWMQKDEFELRACLHSRTDYNNQLLNDAGGSMRCLEARVKFTVSWETFAADSDRTVSLLPMWNKWVTIATAPRDKFMPDNAPIITLILAKV